MNNSGNMGFGLDHLFAPSYKCFHFGMGNFKAVILPFLCSTHSVHWLWALVAFSIESHWFWLKWSDSTNPVTMVISPSPLCSEANFSTTWFSGRGKSCASWLSSSSSTALKITDLSVIFFHFARNLFLLSSITAHSHSLQGSKVFFTNLSWFPSFLGFCCCVNQILFLSLWFS